MDEQLKQLHEALRSGRDIFEALNKLSAPMSKEEQLLQLKLTEINRFIKKVLEINEVSTNNPVSFKASVRIC